MTVAWEYVQTHVLQSTTRPLRFDGQVVQSKLFRSSFSTSSSCDTDAVASTGSEVFLAVVVAA